MQNDFLAVELVVHQYIHVVLFLGNVDRDIDAATLYVDWNGFGVVLIFQKECEVLGDGTQLNWDESELDSSWRIAFNFGCSFEADGGKESIKLKLSTGLGFALLGEIFRCQKWNLLAISGLDIYFR
jgi:hypothetical protein